VQLQETKHDTRLAATITSNWLVP